MTEQGRLAAAVAGDRPEPSCVVDTGSGLDIAWRAVAARLFIGRRAS
jgi:hypothetical protein